MKYITLLIGILLLLNSNVYSQNQNQIILVGKLIDKAGLQRMLTQRMGKIYMTMYIGTEVNASQIKLNKTIDVFEKQLAYLKSINITPSYNQALAKTQHQWNNYKKIIQSRPNKENVEKLLKNNHKILAACEDVVNQLELYASRISSNNKLYQLNKNIVNLENRAGRQRMLTERVLFYYLAYQAIIGEASGIKKTLNPLLEEYQQSLNLLKNALENSPEIDYRLALLDKEWNQIKAYCSQKKSTANDIQKVLEKGNKLFETMDVVTKLYESIIDVKIAALILNNAIKMSDQQPLLIQKITTAYIKDGMEEGKGKHRENMNQYIDKFETHHKELFSFAPTVQLKETLNEMAKIWTISRVELDKNSTKEGLQLILKNNMLLNTSSAKIVSLLKTYANAFQNSSSGYNSKLTYWNTKITKQNVYAEQIITCSYALAWNVQNEEMIQIFKNIESKYTSNLKELGTFSGNKQLKIQSDKLAKNWDLAHAYLQDPQNHKQDLISWSSQQAKELNALTFSFKRQINRMIAEKIINKANNLCLLSQKIATTSLVIGLHLSTSQQNQKLKKDKLLFGRQLTELKKIALNSDAQSIIATISQNWENYEDDFNASIQKENVLKLLNQSEQMLASCNVLVQKIEKKSPNDNVKLVNYAAKLRTMTQQILLYHIAGRWGFTDYKPRIETTLVKYKEIVNKLATGSHNSTKSKNLLANIKTLVARLEKYSNSSEEVDFYSIFSVCNVIMLQSEKLTKTYENMP